MATFIVEVPDAHLPNIGGADAAWRMARLVFEAVEEGSSRHCTEGLYAGLDRRIGYKHHRLGVSVRIVPGFATEEV